MFSNAPTVTATGAPVSSTLEETLAGWLLADSADACEVVHVDADHVPELLRRCALRLASSIPSDVLSTFAYSCIARADFRKVRAELATLYTPADREAMLRTEDAERFPGVATEPSDALIHVVATGHDAAHVAACGRELARRLQEMGAPTDAERDETEQLSRLQDAANRRDYAEQQLPRYESDFM